MPRQGEAGARPQGEELRGVLQGYDLRLRTHTAGLALRLDAPERLSFGLRRALIYTSHNTRSWGGSVRHMKPSRRSVLKGAGATIAAPFLTCPASAQTWPARPV